jgi:hypothetical protein
LPDSSECLLTGLSACYRSTFATVEVGPNKKVYTIHKDLLAFYSDYFRAAFHGSFKEATESKITLTDECEDVFDIFHQFIYSRIIADGNGEELSSAVLVSTWIFGDKYLVLSLQNAIMDALVKKRKINHVVPTRHVSKVWEKTMPSSPLRRYFLDGAVYRLGVAGIRDHEDRWTREALLDLVEAFDNKEVVKKNKLPARAECYYHIHHDGEEC